MATQGGNLVMETFEAGADLSSHQFKFVKLSGGKVVLCSVAQEKALGILQNTPQSGEGAAVALHGLSKVKCAGILAVDSIVATDAAGLAIAGVAATGMIMGQLTKASGGANEIAQMMLQPVGAAG